MKTCLSILSAALLLSSGCATSFPNQDLVQENKQLIQSLQAEVAQLKSLQTPNRPEVQSPADGQKFFEAFPQYHPDKQGISYNPKNPLQSIRDGFALTAYGTQMDPEQYELSGHGRLYMFVEFETNSSRVTSYPTMTELAEQDVSGFSQIVAFQHAVSRSPRETILEPIKLVLNMDTVAFPELFTILDRNIPVKVNIHFFGPDEDDNAVFKASYFVEDGQIDKISTVYNWLDITLSYDKLRIEQHYPEKTDTQIEMLPAS